MQITIAQIVDIISKKTGLTPEEINTKIAAKMEELAGLVSEEGAAHIIANEYQVSLDKNFDQEIIVKDLKPYLKNLKITVKIVTLYEEIEFDRNDQKGKVRSAIVGDQSGVTKAVFWHSAADAITNAKEGDILTIKKATSKTNNGRNELHVNADENITINPEGIDFEVAQKQQAPEIKKIAELNQDEVVSLKGIIVQSFNPNFFMSCPECRKRLTEKNGEYFCDIHGKVEPKQGCVLNIVIDDGSGNVRCVSFSENAEKVYGDKITKESFEKDKLVGKLVTIIGKVRYSTYSQKNEIIVYDVE